MADGGTDAADAGWAFLIGALAGAGIALLLRSEDDETGRIVRRLREQGICARRATGRRARDLGRLIALTRGLRERIGP